MREREIQAGSIGAGILLDGEVYSLAIRDGRSEAVRFPAGWVLEVELGPSGAAAWVNGQQVRR